MRNFSTSGARGAPPTPKNRRFPPKNFINFLTAAFERIFRVNPIRMRKRNVGDFVRAGLTFDRYIFSMIIGTVNMVVGAGIFVLPGLVAAELGSAAILAYLICSVTVALVFLCFAEVGSRVSRSGGCYAYIEEAFGPFAGFIASILFWFGFAALADAAITVIMVDSIAVLFPVMGKTVPRAIFIITVLTFLAAVNVQGVKAGVRLVIFNTLAKLVPLLLLLVAGLFVMNFENLVIPEWPTAASIGSGTILLFYAFNGAESALNTSGEIKSPARTVPLGLMFGLGGILLLYIGLQTVSQGVLGPGLANSTKAPLVAVATEVFFNTPVELCEHEPALYTELQAFYRQHPAARHSAATPR